MVFGEKQRHLTPSVLSVLGARPILKTVLSCSTAKLSSSRISWDDEGAGRNILFVYSGGWGRSGLYFLSSRRLSARTLR